MGINEEILRLRLKMSEAVDVGFMNEESKGTYEMVLLQIMNESDRQRLNCTNRAEQLKMQAATAEGQAAAFSMISSIVNNVFGSMVGKTAKMLEEEKMLSADKEKGQEDENGQAVKKVAKKTTRKTRTKKAT
jgi:hypothetical protein